MPQTGDTKDMPAQGRLPAPSTLQATASFIRQYPVVSMAVLLFVLVTGMFLASLNNGFVNYDDDLYVTQNNHVRQGLTLGTIAWAFRSREATNWHPLTWISHMLDYEIFGLEPWGHHLVSLLFHALNTALLFLVLQRMTGAMGRSFFVAALFGLHPLHVESVVWVAERKDVLSTFFWLLTMLAYARYVQESKAQSNAECGVRSADLERGQRPRPKVFYGLALVCFALGLMSKPMLVTLPFVLLLMDYWPLRRIYDLRFTIYESNDLKSDPAIKGPPDQSTLPVIRKLIWEKAPFFLIAAVASAVTFWVQSTGGATTMIAIAPAARFENALVSYCRYLGKLFYPVNLCVAYPHPGYWPTGTVVLAGLLLIGISAFVILMGRKLRYLPVGWFWYVGTLVPVIGLVQVGEMSMADRYSYVPLIGLSIMLAWGMCDLTARWRHQYRVLSVAAALALVVCATLTCRQIGFWRDSETLFRHAIALTGTNTAAYNNLGVALTAKGQYDESISDYQKTLQARPDDSVAHNNLGAALQGKGQIDEAIIEYKKAIQAKHDYANAYYNLGLALQGKGQLDDAIPLYQQAIAFKPEYLDARNNLAVALFQKGRFEEAVSQLQTIVKVKPDYAGAYFNLGNMLLKMGRLDEAATQFQAALRQDPNNAYAEQNLGDIYARQGKVEEADKHHQEAQRLIMNTPH